MNRKQITKEWLENQGIDIDLENQKIYHTSKRLGKTELKHLISTQYKKHGIPVTYEIVGWYSAVDHRQYSFPVHRLFYVWKNGSIGDLDVDHKDNNSLNNNIDNLIGLDHKSNMQKRPGNGHNDSLYYGMYGLSDEEVDALQERIRNSHKDKADKIKENKSLSELSHNLKEEKKKLRQAYLMAKEQKPEQYNFIRKNYLFNLHNLNYAIEQCKYCRAVNTKHYKDEEKAIKDYINEKKEKYYEK